ncbi:MAG: ABC transporter permease [Gammaproteobacteria bacterium]|nr:ABC transporter permease [Gammaproteobacteria bacterium]
MNFFALRLDYFNDSVIDWAKDNVGWATVRLQAGADPDAVIAGIDGLFENSSDPTQSLTEDEYARQFANQLGDMEVITTLILIAVFFTIVLLTANVATLTFNERIAELGVLKTLGFGDGEVALLVLAESAGLCVSGAAMGIALAFAFEPALREGLALVFGSFSMRWRDAAIALSLALTMGVAVGWSPASAARRLPIVDSLRVTGN